jgi:hypothetical protein
MKELFSSVHESIGANPQRAFSFSFEHWWFRQVWHTLCSDLLSLMHYGHGTVQVLGRGRRGHAEEWERVSVFVFPYCAT